MAPSFDADALAKVVDEFARAAAAVSGDSSPVDPAMERRLLVVDDDESVRHVVAEILKDEGYEPSTADGAEAALEIMRKTGFPLVITDIKMPDKDGLWFLRALRSEFPSTAVIMMTGLRSGRERGRSAEAWRAGSRRGACRRSPATGGNRRSTDATTRRAPGKSGIACPAS